MKKRYLETLDGDGYKIYLYWASFTVLIKFALSISWTISVIIAMVVTLVIQWLYNRHVSKLRNDIIENHYELAKENGYRTIETTMDGSSNTKMIELRKELSLDNSSLTNSELSITMHLSTRGISILYTPVGNYPTLEALLSSRVTISGSIYASLSADDLDSIYENAAGNSAIIPKLIE